MTVGNKVEYQSIYFALFLLISLNGCILKSKEGTNDSTRPEETTVTKEENLRDLDREIDSTWQWIYNKFNDPDNGFELHVDYTWFNLQHTVPMDSPFYDDNRNTDPTIFNGFGNIGWQLFDNPFPNIQLDKHNLLIPIIAGKKHLECFEDGIYLNVVVSIDLRNINYYSTWGNYGVFESINGKPIYVIDKDQSIYGNFAHSGICNSANFKLYPLAVDRINKFTIESLGWHNLPERVKRAFRRLKELLIEKYPIETNDELF